MIHEKFMSHDLDPAIAEHVQELGRPRNPCKNEGARLRGHRHLYLVTHAYVRRYPEIKFPIIELPVPIVDNYQVSALHGGKWLPEPAKRQKRPSVQVFNIHEQNEIIVQYPEVLKPVVEYNGLDIKLFHGVSPAPQTIPIGNYGHFSAQFSENESRFISHDHGIDRGIWGNGLQSLRFPPVTPRKDGEFDASFHEFAAELDHERRFAASADREVANGYGVGGDMRPFAPEREKLPCLKPHPIGQTEDIGGDPEHIHVGYIKLKAASLKRGGLSFVSVTVYL